MLLLDEPSHSLTELFHHGKVPEASLGEHPVLARWARVARMGVAPDSPGYPDGTSGADLGMRRDRLLGALREDSTLLESIAGELAARDVVTLLCDRDGVILASRGGAAFRDAAAKVRLVEGARWSEGVRGTNAIGTAVAEGKAVGVVGHAHYEMRIGDLFCYATPVRDPYGDVIAVVDVTGPMDHHDRTLSTAVESAGTVLERALRAHAFARVSSGGLPLLERLLARSRDPAMLVEASGGVRLANEAARVVLAAATRGATRPGESLAKSAPLTCERVFGMPFDRLAGMARTRDAGMRFEAHGMSFRVALDPIAGPDGRELAIVVHLDPVARRRVLDMGRSLPLAEASHPAFAPLIGTDPAFVHAKALAQRFALTPLPVLLLAETGTGKELFARAIHGASAVGRGPFVALNCAAISESLLESELFGHAPGAFTGATRTGSEGKIGAARGGTLFLDEVAEMPQALQAALLRVLEDGTYYRVGEDRPRRSEFRLVCATSRDLPALVDKGEFRSDLFYRIHGGTVRIPPLRDRSDRLFLARSLLGEMHPATGDGAQGSVLSEDAALWIEEHTWPGNVRELRSALLHARALAGDAPITRDHFPEVLVPGSGVGSHGHRPRPGERSKVEALRDEYAAAIRASSGNVAEAARRLGVARSTLYRALKR